MTPITSILNWLMPLIYLALVIQYGSAMFLRGNRHSRNLWLLPAIVVHAGFLALRAVAAGRLAPVNNYEVLSFLALATAAVYCVVEFALRERRSGLFVMLVVFLFQYTSSVGVPQAAAHAPMGAAVRYDVGALHILWVIIAYTGFTMAAVYGRLYLLAERNLRLHKVGLFFDRLPALEMLAKMLWHAMLLGFAFMTLSILTGIWTYWSGPRGQFSAPPEHVKMMVKIIAGTAAWAIYALAVGGRLAGKCSAPWLARVAVYGFALVMVLLIASIAFS